MMGDYIVRVNVKDETEYQACIKLTADNATDAQTVVERMIEEEEIDMDDGDIQFSPLDGDRSDYYITGVEPYDINGTYYPWQWPTRDGEKGALADELSVSSELLEHLLPNKRAYLGRHRGGDLPISQVFYLAVRPTKQLDDDTVSALIDEHEEVQLQVGEAGYPSYVAAIYHHPIDAIQDALSVRAVFPHVRVHYNGLEFLGEFDSWRTLAQLIRWVDDEWDVAEEIASGNKNIGNLNMDDYSNVLWAVLAEIAQEFDQQQGGK